jgi:hypothetical protein
MKSEDSRKMGMIFWEGERSDIASHCFGDVQTLQQGLIELGQYLERIEW